MRHHLLLDVVFRQFEFIQQQWLNYGLDFNAGNHGCPLLGNRHGDNAKFVIAVDPESGKAPFICSSHPAVRGNARRRLLLRPEHDGASHDGHGHRRPDLSRVRR